MSDAKSWKAGRESATTSIQESIESISGVLKIQFPTGEASTVIEAFEDQLGGVLAWVKSDTTYRYGIAKAALSSQSDQS